MPDVSVILPVFNGVKYLPFAIESVLSQSFCDFEFLIIDDGSTENVVDVIASYDDPRIRFFSRKNKGLGATLNELIFLSRGTYIVRMDGDDICHQNRINDQICFMKNNSDCVMVGGQIDFLVDDNVINAFPMPVCSNVIKSGLLEARFPICHPAVTFLKSTAISVGGYRIGGAGEDLDFFIRMSEVGRISNISQKVLGYRIQTNSLSVRKSKELNRAYAFALHNERLRRKGVFEITIEAFDENVWKKRNLRARAMEFSRNYSDYFYRKSIIARATKEQFSFVLFIFVAAVLKPIVSMRRTFQKLESWLFRENLQ